MTILISDNSPRISYVATAGQTVFTVPFEFFDNSDLNVFINDVLKTITTDYTVTGGNGSTGTVTLVTGATVGDSIVITRKVTLERVTDFPTSGPFQVASLNIELDKLVAMVADLQDLANRGLRLSDSDITERLTLASTNERKGTVLAFNATTGAVEVGPTIADTNTVAQIKADISTVAGISANVTTVAGISGNVTTVAGVSSDVTTVAGQTTNMQNITDNLTDIQNAPTNATNAATSASNAASSETAAASSASSAATSEANAATSETNAATSASSAASSASTATTKASEAATSATNAATSETNAATSATNAATSETNAGNSAASALASEGSAAASASNAAISETNSATSATDASNSAISAANSAASAAAAFDNFDDTYLGSFATDPTTDNDGDPLVEGALYFNSTSNEMRVYDGASWIAASSSGAASMLEYNYTATASQTTFSGADDNSATLSYTADNIIVTLNGVVLENSTDYTATDGTSIVLTTGAALDDELNIIAFKSFTVSDTVAASTGGTFNGSVAVNGDLTVDTDTLFVDSTNNRIGIGTTSPIDSQLDIRGTAGVKIGDGTCTLELLGRSDVGFGIIGTDTNHDLVMRTNNVERMRIDTFGSFSFNSGYGSVAKAYGCRAWVNFDGTGVVSIRESGNVSSVTDNGTGVYTLNFSTAMPDANYSVVTSGTMRGNTSAATGVLQIHNISSGNPTTPQLMTTTAVRLSVKANGYTPWDIPVGTVSIFR